MSINLFAGLCPRLTYQLETQGRNQDLLHLLVRELRANLEETKDGLNVGLAHGGQAEKGAVEGLEWEGKRKRV
jgi:hypothetical protein